MLAVLLAKIELELDTANDSGSLGFLTPLMIMGALFVVVAGLAGVLTQRRRSIPEPQPSSPAPSPAYTREELAKHMNTILHAKERRRHSRRGGNRITVEVAFPQSSEPPVEGVVLDRSRGGLLLALPRAAEAGSFLSIVPPKAPPELGPIRVEVRHCQQKEDRWLAGCKFEQALPLGTLFLFG